MGEGRVGVITIRKVRTSARITPHPGPLPQGEREFPGKNKLKGFIFVVSPSVPLRAGLLAGVDPAFAAAYDAILPFPMKRWFIGIFPKGKKFSREGRSK